jgi:hypothetical protein
MHTNKTGRPAALAGRPILLILLLAKNGMSVIFEQDTPVSRTLFVKISVTSQKRLEETQPGGVKTELPETIHFISRDTNS